MLLVAIAVAAAGAQAAVVAERNNVQPVRPESRTARLSAAQMFALADRAQSLGDLQAAANIFQALADDPDPEVSQGARFRHAKQLIAANDTAKAAVLLRSILDDRPDATGVRFELAGLLYRLGDHESALRQLRALQASRLPLSMARLIDRYAVSLRDTRPAGFNVEIAVAPDSNISRATRSDTLGTVIGDFEIDKDSQAKSGVGLALRGDVFRRIGIAGNHRMVLRAGGTADLYRRTEFNDIAVDIAAMPQFHLGRRRLGLELGLSQRWYRQKPFVRTVRLGGSLTQPFGRRTQLRLSGNAARIDNRQNDLQDGNSYAAQTSLERALSPVAGLGLVLGADRYSARDPGYSTTGWRASLLGWRDVGRATLTAQAEFGRLRADERLMLFPDKRSDRLERWTIGATFRQLTFGGFAPVTRLIVERNRSTLEFYNYKRIRTEFGIARAF